MLLFQCVGRPRLVSSGPCMDGWMNGWMGRPGDGDDDDDDDGHDDNDDNDDNGGCGRWDGHHWMRKGRGHNDRTNTTIK